MINISMQNSNVILRFERGEQVIGSSHLKWEGSCSEVTGRPVREIRRKEKVFRMLA